MMADCKLYSSFNILIHLLIFVLRYLWSEAFNKISGEFSQWRKGKERGQRLKEKKWDSFEWENKTMKISRHIADASIVLWPSLAWSWEQLNPSLTNKSGFSSKPGEDFIKRYTLCCSKNIGKYILYLFPSGSYFKLILLE